MPWRITRFLFKDMISVFLVGIVGLSSLFVVILLMQIMRKIEGVGSSSLLELMPTIAFGYQSHFIPVACVLGAAIAYGRMHSERETIAVYAGGVAPRKLLIPALIVGFVLCIPASYANFVSSPKAYRERDGLKRRALADVLDNPPSGAHTLSFPNIKISYTDYRDEAFEGVVVLTTDKDDRVDNMLACTRAALRFSETTSVLTLLGASDATLLHFGEDGRVSGPSIRLHVRSLSEKLPVDTREGRISPKADAPSDLLTYMSDEFEQGGNVKYHTGAEFVKRTMFSLAPLIFTLAGALIGLLLPTRNRIITLAAALALAGALFYPATLLATSATVNGIFASLGPVWLVGLPVILSVTLAAAVLWLIGWRLHRV